MPVLDRLTITAIRNIRETELFPAPRINIIVGDNGSGKTSLLEAISLLSLGRSFRTHQHLPLIMHGQQTAVVHAFTDGGQSLGVQKFTKGPTVVHINDTKAASLAHLARELPIQVLNSDGFRIFEGSPSDRRAFMDWGVFHVKHQFLDTWRRVRRALINRNALLKQNANNTELEPWSHELAVHSLDMHQMRKEYLKQLWAAMEEPLATIMLEALGGHSPSITYSGGWDEDKDLHQLLAANIGREKKVGHTLYGPHRADLRFQLKGQDCSELLSRGQLKLFVALLKIAQAEQLVNQGGKLSIFLVDDLPSELDWHNQKRVCQRLAALGAQVFLTAIEPGVQSALGESSADQSSLFHVKHGKIGPAANLA
jgi:DNA replication and repair protein RecF